VALSLAGRSAAAEPVVTKRPVFVERTTCEATSLDAVVSILRVELLGRFVDGPPPDDSYRAAITCSASIVGVTVGAPGGAAQSLRTDLSAAPANVRARIVALDVAELVRSLDAEPHPALSAAPPAPRSAELGPAPLPPPVPRAWPVGLGAFGQASSFPRGGVWLTGGGLRFDLVTRHVCAGFDVALLVADDRFAEGSVQTSLAYAAPAVAWRASWSAADVRLGAGYALGAARLSGHANDPRAFAGATTGPWTAPYLFAAFALALTGVVHVDVRAQAGWVSSPVVGEVAGSADLALEGPWVSGQLGLSLSL
jgi:hypothetical protein